MKRILALILALVMCLPLCACGNSQAKYAGTYVCEADKTFGKGSDSLNGTIGTLILYEDGTGYSKEEVSYTESPYWTVGEIQSEASVTWMENEGYITVSYNEKKYYDTFPGHPCKNNPVETFRQVTYEAKGTQLLGTKPDGSIYTYVKQS